MKEDPLSEHTSAPRPDVTDMYAVHGVFRDTLGAVPRARGRHCAGGRRPGGADRELLRERPQLPARRTTTPRRSWSSRSCGSAVPARTAPLESSSRSSTQEAIKLLEEALPALSAWPSGDAGSQKATEDALDGAARPVGPPPRRRGGAGAAPRRGQPLDGGVGRAAPGHGMANFHGDKIWLILGLIRVRMTEEQRAAMLEHMPPPALETWTGFGEQAFKD